MAPATPTNTDTTPDPTANKPRRRNLRWILAISAILILGAALIVVPTAVHMIRVANASPEAVWTPATGDSIPRDFRYLAFPKDNNVDLLQTDGTPSGVKLTRAFACSPDEYEQGDTIGVWHNDTELFVPKNRITFMPNSPNAATLVDNWKQTLAGWGPATSDYRSSNATWEQLPNNTYRVTVQMTHRKGDRTYSIYTVSPDSLQPQSLEHSRRW